MKALAFLLLFIFSLYPLLFAQINSAGVTIARDAYGVPHIFAKTDPEVAYGLAWAHAEDDFKTIQLLILPTKGLLGRHLGKKGAAADYVVELLHAPELVAEQGAAALSPGYRALLNGYLQGLNDYARTHPAEVLVKGAFPVSINDYLKAVVLSLSVISGVDQALQAIYGGRVPTVDWLKPAGSNALAVHPAKTTEGKTLLAINSHQPLEGPVAWYEAHLCSEQGWNILGGLFP
ncbi:MAG TPA: penicillin acylase family protein, partial [Spirosoma sp.]|nr:penicillin acylase family protein [Spirosoma sp.]